MNFSPNPCSSSLISYMLNNNKKRFHQRNILQVELLDLWTFCVTSDLHPASTHLSPRWMFSSGRSSYLFPAHFLISLSSGSKDEGKIYTHVEWLVQRRQWQPTPVLLSGKSYGRRSLVGCSPWGPEESDTTERLHFHFSLSRIGEGNGNPLQRSCLENPRDGGAWWPAVYRVAELDMTKAT